MAVASLWPGVESVWGQGQGRGAGGVRLSLAPRRGRGWASLAVKYTQNPCPHQRSPGLGTGMQGAVISS